MDIYEATQALLTEAAPDANVTYYLLTYDEQKDQFSLPKFPCVTYLYANIMPLVDHEGVTNLNRVELVVEVWGALEDVSANATAIFETMSGQRIEVENIVFTVVASESRDVYDYGLDYHRRTIRFGGLVEIGAEKDDSR